MEFFLSVSPEDFSNWLAEYYFEKYRIIHKFEPKVSADGRSFYQFGTPEPPIVILAIYVEPSPAGIAISIEAFDRPGNEPGAISECIQDLHMAADALLRYHHN